MLQFWFLLLLLISMLKCKWQRWIFYCEWTRQSYSCYWYISFFNVFFGILLILLIGSTGFVGAHLLKQILKEKPLSRVVCLVRNTSQFTSSQNRLQQVLQRFQIWNDLQSDICRLSVLEGDFGKDKFGLSETNYNELLESVGESWFSFLPLFLCAD